MYIMTAINETQMMDSLLMGLAALPTDTRRVLIALADVPLVKEKTIEALLARWQAMQAELQAAGQAAFQKYFGRWEEDAR